MAEPEERLITWRNFEYTYVSDGFANVVSAPGSPLVEFYVEEGGSRIGLRTPCDDVEPIQRLRLSEVEARRILISGEQLLDFSTQSRPLYRQFFELMRDIADRIQVSGRAVADAVIGAVNDMRQLASADGLMSAETQHGLFGELLLFHRLLLAGVVNSTEAWTGARGDPHDIRLEGLDLEVKTRVGAKRVHRIHDAAQLQPTEGRELFVVSVLLCHSNDGRSLPQLVNAVRGLLDLEERTRYRNLLEGYGPGPGYHEEDSIHYLERLSLRENLVAIPVTAAVPSINPTALRKGLGTEAAGRVGRVAYDVDFEGLGFEDGSDGFLRLIPLEKSLGNAG